MLIIKSLVKNRLARVVVGGLFVVLFLFVIIFFVSLVPTKLVVSLNSDSQTMFKKLGEVQSYEDYFQASNNLLNRIDVLFKNPNLESRDELEVLLFDDKEKIVVIQKFNGFNLGDTTQARINFNPIPDSKNKYYRVLIRPTSIVDGKLSFGIRDGKIEILQYYNSGVNVRDAWERLLFVTTRIARYQIVVILLPVLLTMILLW